MDTPRKHRTIKHSPGWIKAREARALRRAKDPEVQRRAARWAEIEHARRLAELATAK